MKEKIEPSNVSGVVSCGDTKLCFNGTTEVSGHMSAKGIFSSNLHGGSLYIKSNKPVAIHACDIKDVYLTIDAPEVSITASLVIDSIIVCNTKEESMIQTSNVCKNSEIKHYVYPSMPMFSKEEIEETTNKGFAQIDMFQDHSEKLPDTIRDRMQEMMYSLAGEGLINPCNEIKVERSQTDPSTYNVSIDFTPTAPIMHLDEPDIIKHPSTASNKEKSNTWVGAIGALFVTGLLSAVSSKKNKSQEKSTKEVNNAIVRL